MVSQSEENINSEASTRINEPEHVNVKWSAFFLFTLSIFLSMASSFMFAEAWIGDARYQNYTFFYEDDVNLYGALPTVCSVLSAIVIVNTVVGFLGIPKRSVRVLIVNGFCSCVVFFIILAVLCLTLTMDSDAFLTSLNIPVQAIKDPEIADEVNFIQSTLGCCGSNDYRDYLSVQFPANMSHTIVMKPDESSGNMVAITLPATCCVNPEELFCTAMWSTGCKIALVSTMVKNFNLLSAVGGGAMVLDVPIIILAVYLFRAYRKEKIEKHLIIQIIRVDLDADEIQKENKATTIPNHPQSSSN